MEAKGWKTARNHFEDKLQQLTVPFPPIFPVFPTFILGRIFALFQQHPASDVYPSNDLTVTKLTFLVSELILIFDKSL